ncbi:MAG: pyruvate, water dikinase, partial [Campylobacterota bacterium]|nr:pyruvate, water dikinase [Campylobacterota bacterium]
MKYIRFFKELSNKDVPIVGGKNASLGEMYQNLSQKGVRVPNGFATTSDAYRVLLKSNNLEEEIKNILNGLDIKDVDELKKRAKAVRELILGAKMPQELEEEIEKAYKELCEFYGKENISVAVRSSATAEDLPEASFAGQQETFLNISGKDELIRSAKKCFASLFTDRAVSYRASRGFDHFQVALSVGIQKMVRSDKASSGIMFSIDTDSGSPELVLVTSTLGLGENIVGGKVNPDEFIVFKPTLKQGLKPILKRQLGSKSIKMIYSDESGVFTKNIQTPQNERDSFSINDDEIVKLAKYAVVIEEHYSNLAGEYRPMDMEWAKDAQDGEIYIVQARPETVQSQKLKKEKTHFLTNYRLLSKEKNILLLGTAVGERIASGKVHIINSSEEFHDFKEGEILVSDNTDPDWEPVMKKASAIITNSGGRTCHAAIVAREMGIAAIVGTKNATKKLKNGMEVTVSCAEGEEGRVYDGALEYDIEKIDIENLKETKTKLYLNIGNPLQAFHIAQLPNHGVGLARMEFIVNNYIKAHPLALVDLYNNNEINEKESITQRIKAYKNPKEFFVNKLSEGIGMI